MEYRLEDYRRHNGRIFQTPDGHKYCKSKVRNNNVYLRCVLFRNGCKATAKLNLVSNLITPAMTGKNEELYKAVLIHIHQLLPELQPTTYIHVRLGSCSS